MRIALLIRLAYSTDLQKDFECLLIIYLNVSSKTLVYLFDSILFMEFIDR